MLAENYRVDNAGLRQYAARERIVVRVNSAVHENVEPFFRWLFRRASTLALVVWRVG